MQPELIIKPEFNPFVIKPTAQLALILVLGAIAATEALSLSELPLPMLPAILAILVFAIIGFNFLTLFVRFNKTTYSFYPDRIMMRTGGLFSEQTVDLQLKNITHVSTTIPFLEHQIFKTGNVYIQAAGAAGTEISMVSIASPMSFYKEVAARMQKNGFSLSRKREIQRERPGLFGTVIQMGEGFATGIIFAGYLAFTALGQLMSDDQSLEASTGLFSSAFSSPLLFLSTAIFFIGGSVYAALHAIDLSRRDYVLYDDVIDYSDGFLTQRHKFIPLENLADVTLTQSLLRRVFNYSDLVVSCQGANTNIAFKVMPRADQFKANLERLIREHKSNQPIHIDLPSVDASARDGQVNDWQASESTSRVAAPQRLRATNRPELELRLSLKRAIGGTALAYGALTIGVLLTALFALTILNIIVPTSDDFFSRLPVGELSFGFLILMVVVTGRDVINHAIAYHATHYRVDDHKIGLHHTMFNKKHTEFTLDKVTAVTLRHGILDRLFGTATLQFHSIGTSEIIAFKHIDDGREIAQDILERLGLQQAQPNRVIVPTFNASNALRAHLDIGAIIVAWAIVSLGVALFYPVFLLQLILVFGLLLVQYSFSEVFYKRARLEIFDSHLRLRQGIFTISSHYAAFHDIKHIHSTQYLNSQTGSLHWTIAGGATRELAFLENVSTRHEQLDNLLYTHPIKAVRQSEQFTATTLTTTKPALANGLTKLLLTSVIVFPLLALLPFTLTVLIIRIRNTQYTAESSRIVRSWGRMYRHRQTILYNRIDHLTTSRGLLNNLFKNGNIGIATVGSTDTDLTLTDFQNHQEFYDTIKQNLPAER